MGVHLDDVRRKGRRRRTERGREEDGFHSLKLPLSEAECILSRRDGQSKDII